MASTTATFTFSSTDPTATFECKIDSSDFRPCTTGDYTGLTEGAHTFEVRAYGPTGTYDPSPAVRSWTIDTSLDTTPPDTTITGGPSGTTGDATPTFEFSSEPGATFECRVDTGAFSSCSSPLTVAALTDGAHTFEVRATDAATNTDPTPASRTFTVDTSPGPGSAKIGGVNVTGPAKLKGGKTATYKVQITNSGSAEATGVKLKVSGKGASSSASVGSIPAGSTRTIKVKLKPKKAGRIKLTFKVTSGNAGGKAVTRTITVRK